RRRAREGAVGLAAGAGHVARGAEVALLRRGDEAVSADRRGARAAHADLAGPAGRAVLHVHPSRARVRVVVARPVADARVRRGAVAGGIGGHTAELAGVVAAVAVGQVAVVALLGGLDHGVAARGRHAVHLHAVEVRAARDAVHQRRAGLTLLDH